jgi:hypothetical protein
MLSQDVERLNAVISKKNDENEQLRLKIGKLEIELNSFELEVKKQKEIIDARNREIEELRNKI